LADIIVCMWWYTSCVVFAAIVNYTYLSLDVLCCSPLYFVLVAVDSAFDLSTLNHTVLYLIA
jgi:hypothetical protein